MKRFILPDAPDNEGIIRLSGGDYHYLVHVRRLRAGSRFPALCAGTACEVEALSTDNNVLTGKLHGEGAAPEPAYSPPPLILFQALPKSAKIDLIVRQAAESALSEIIVFVSERSVPRPEETGRRLERWRRIIREARQQSGSAVDTAPRFYPTLEAALSHWAELVRQTQNAAPEAKTAALLLREPAAGDPLEQGTFHGYLDSMPALAALAVGPEGGFSAGEVCRFQEAGFKSVRIGESVLRTETAALYAIAAARIILLERTVWTLNAPNHAYAS